MAMSVLITGAGGLVGRHLTSYLRGKGYEVFAATKECLDVTDFQQCKELISNFQPDIVVHAAAYTSVDGAEREPEKVNLVNVSGTRNIALSCAKIKIPMLFLSTCAVFDGHRDTPYMVGDVENPLSVYAKSKFAAEKEIKMLLNEFYILRVMHIYGKGRTDFVTQTIEKLKTMENPDIPIIGQYLNITSVTSLCEAILDLIESGRFGVYHYSNEGKTTRWQIVQYIAKILGKTEYTISTYDVKTAVRPYYSIMDNSEIKMVLKKPIPTWQDSLRKFICNSED